MFYCIPSVDYIEKTIFFLLRAKAALPRPGSCLQAGLFVSSGSSAHGAHSGAPPPPLRQARSHRQQHNTTSALAASASHSQQEQEHIFIRASIPQLHTVVCARPTPGRRVFILPLFKIYFYYRREVDCKYFLVYLRFARDGLRF